MEFVGDFQYRRSDIIGHGAFAVVFRGSSRLVSQSVYFDKLPNRLAKLLLSCSLEEYSRSHLALTPPTLLTNNLLSHLTEPTLVLTPLTVYYLANQYAYQARRQVISRESKSGPSNKITSGSTECRGII